jgi:putative ABC transport system permease protein
MALWQDVRFAARLLVKDRWFTLAAATALALGIGANAAVFTFVNAVLIRGLPFEDPDQIIAMSVRDARGRQSGVSYPEFGDWREQAQSLSHMVATVGATVNVSDEGKTPEQFQGSYVSASLFPMIGERPVLGRLFTEADDRKGAEPVAILGNGIWKNRYGADPSILGRTIKANSKVYTVIGVMRPDMQFPNNDALWMPLEQLPPATLDPRREIRSLFVIGRLKKDTSLPQAQAEFAAIGQRLADTYPANKDFRPYLQTFLDRSSGGPLRTVFLALMGAVAFVLLIACADVANLLLARATHRSREIAIRSALGASRWRVVRQLLIESLLLALISGAGGLVFAIAGIRWFDRATQDVGKPYWMTFNMDATVVAFMAAVCLGTAIVFGLAPALHISKTDANEILKEGGRGGTSGVRARRWTGVLIVTELVLTVVLLAGAGFMMKSFLELYRFELGLDISHILTMQLYLPQTKYPEPGPRTAVYEQFEERLRGIGEIQASSLANTAPLMGGFTRMLEVEGHPPATPESRQDVTIVSIGDTYFDTLNLKLARGRALNREDGRPGHEAAVVNQRLATMYFPSEDPIGRRIKLTADPPGAHEEWTTIVGIAPTVRQRFIREPQPDPIVYLPYRADPQRNATLMIRTFADPGKVTASVREALRVVEPDLPLFRIATMSQLLGRQRWPFQVFGTMFAVFAGIALVLSSVGLYAVTAYSVTQRTQEIGIRMALGAQPRGMLWLVLRRALIQLAIGLSLGVAGAFGVGKILQSILIQTSAGDPVTLGLVVVLLIAVALLASLWPARRAAGLDPMLALRYE